MAVGRDIALYTHTAGYEPQICHLFILKSEFLATQQLNKNIFFLNILYFNILRLFFLRQKKPYFYAFS
jgi:hypothetical protein